MPESTQQQQTAHALGELQRYLGDEIAPLMAADSMEILLDLAPEHSAAAVRGWLEHQPGDSPIADYIFHAIKKLQLFAEFQLVEVNRFTQYLNGVSRCLLPLCPPEERDALKLRLSHIGDAETTLSGPVRLLHRELGTEEQERELKELEERQAKANETQEKSRKLSVLLNRLDLPEVGGESGREALIPHLLSTAAIESRTGSDFESMVAGLRERGVEAKLEKVFRQLAQRLPGWTVRGEDGQEETTADRSRLIRAMHRIVALAGSADESGKRFGEMVYAAIEQFNDGHLAQAVAMIDTASRLIEENKVDREIAKAVRGRAQGSVSLDPLRRFASQTSKHALLRRVLRFFPAFSAAGLLDRLDGEKKREIRRLLMSLLEVHGPPCRPLVLDRLLSASVGELQDPHGFYRRNLVHLLRRIPESESADREHELRVLADMIEPGQPLLLVKEVIAALGALADPRAADLLVEQLRVLERQAGGGDGAVFTDEERDGLLDRLCASLGRIGTPKAIRAVARHALAPGARELGDTSSRLESLSCCDLTADPKSLAAVVKELERRLPKRILRMSFGGDDAAIVSHVRALSATPASEVRQLLQRVARDFEGREFARAAADVLRKMSAERAQETADPAGEQDALKGNLELFGLPVLLQSLADSKATGVLKLDDARGQTRSDLALADGTIVACRTGRLEGLDAVCQLLEDPRPGTFRFDGAQRPAAAASAGEPLDVLSTLMEGLRRHDEFQEARALVPDGSVLSATGVKPTALPDDHDAELARAVWQHAAKGMPPETCEAAVKRDAFTVRRHYAWWLEQGALELAAATA